MPYMWWKWSEMKRLRRWRRTTEPRDPNTLFGGRHHSPAERAVWLAEYQDVYDRLITRGRKPDQASRSATILADMAVSRERRRELAKTKPNMVDDEINTIRNRWREII